MGVEFVYEDLEQTEETVLPSEDISFEGLAHLSTVQRSELYEAAVNLDQQAIKHMLIDIDKDFPVLAASLRSLMEQFEYERLQELLRLEKD